jgi:hypothetical protein
MTSQLQKDYITQESEQASVIVKKPKLARPNIDNLIQRILVERKKEKKRAFLACTFVLLAISGIIIFSL